MDAVFCPTCHMWLADAVQLKDHNRGKRHRRAAGLCKPPAHEDPVRAMVREFARSQLLLLYMRCARVAQALAEP